ncbi:MAG: hypothetical protein ABW171_15395 [Steroidobacter sp.]
MKSSRAAGGCIACLLSFVLLAACGGGGGSGSGSSPGPAPAPPPTNTTPPPAAPLITMQPQAQRITEAQTVSFSVQAISDLAMNYQWLREGTPIPGATAATYSLVARLDDHNQRFWVLITNSGGSVTSAAALLQVDAAPPPPVAPNITLQPTNTSVQVGQAALFSVMAEGDAPFTYQWQRNGVAIPNATTSTYTVPLVATSDDGVRFSVQISNSVGSVQSAVAVLTVLALPVAPSIATLQGPNTLQRGDTATLSVVADGDPPLTYQWRRNGVAISGATAASHDIPNVDLDDHLIAYSVVVTNAAGTVASKPLVLRIADAPEISAGNFFSLAASRTTGALTWGSQSQTMALGRNPERDEDPLSGATAVPLPNGTTVQSVAAGQRHGLALRSDGTVWAWGSDRDGTLGIGRHPLNDPYIFDHPVQTLLPPGVVITKIAAGLDFSIALDTTGQVWGWGTNEACQTGIGFPGGESPFTNGRHTPIAAALPPEIVDIAAGESFTVALDSSGNIWSWGSNPFGGFGSSTPVIVDLDLPASVHPRRVFAGEHHAMLIDDNGDAWAWGEHDDGELGVGETPPITPVRFARKVQLALPSGVAIVAIASGESHSLFLTSDGAVYAAGEERSGALGNGQNGINVIYKTPQRTSTIGPPNLRAIAIAAGQVHSLAILSDGTVMGWGANSSGQLGDGTLDIQRTSPVATVGVDLE